MNIAQIARAAFEVAGALTKNSTSWVEADQDSRNLAIEQTRSIIGGTDLVTLAGDDVTDGIVAFAQTVKSLKRYMTSAVVEDTELNAANKGKVEPPAKNIDEPATDTGVAPVPLTAAVSPSAAPSDAEGTESDPTAIQKPAGKPLQASDPNAGKAFTPAKTPENTTPAVGGQTPGANTSEATKKEEPKA